MKRSPLKRRTPLRRVNPERLERRRQQGLVYGPYHDFISRQPCILRGVRDHYCIGDVVGHHIKSVGAGGLDYGNEVPACTLAHVSLHQLGNRKFCSRWCVSLRAEARALADRWDREQAA